MIDHTGVGVSDLARSRVFSEAAPAQLGDRQLIAFAGYVGFSEPEKPDFWIGAGRVQDPPIQVAFRARDRATIDAFDRAALAGERGDNGAPGLRPQDHPNSYGLFVLDTDGHKIEAVCHDPA